MVFSTAPGQPVSRRMAIIHGSSGRRHAVLALSALAMVAGVLADPAVGSRRSRSSATRLGARARGRGAPGRGTLRPSEVQPLVDDLNALLDQREQAVQRALAKAGDLAHGLKTPLARAGARRRARASGSGTRSWRRRCAQQVERMRRQIDYHLAHARAAASGATPGARSLVADSVDGLARTLHRLHADAAISIDVRVDAVARRPRPARGSRRDARQPARQRLQMGALARRRRIRTERRRASSSPWTTMDQGCRRR